MNGIRGQASVATGVENRRRDGGVGDHSIDSSFEGARDAWVELERALGQAIGLELEGCDKDDVSPIESSQNNGDNNTSPCHERSIATAILSGEVDDDIDDVENRTAEEPEIIISGAISSELNLDTEEITNESDVILDTGIGGPVLHNEEVDDDNANSSSAQCFHPIDPFQPQLDEDSVLTTSSPCPAEVIPEAEAVHVNDSSYSYHAKVNSAAVVSCS